MALLVASPTDNAQALAGTATLTVPAGGVPANSSAQSIVVADPDIVAATTFTIMTIDAASSGTAQFTSGGGQAIVCIEGAACDTDAAVGTITVNLTGTGTVGTVVVNVRLVDAVDGLDGAGDDSDIVTVAYQQNAVATSLTLYAGNAATGANANGSSIPATPASAADQVVVAARITTSTGAPITPTAGSAVFFSAGASGTGIFNDSQGAAASDMPDAWDTAVGLGDVTAYDAAAAGNSGCMAPGGIGNAEGQQACTGLTDTLDDGETGELQATAAVMFEGAGIAGDATIVAKSGGLTSNSVTITLFGPPANVAVAPATGATCTGAQVGGSIANGDCSRTSNLAGSGTAVTLTVTDALGFPVAGFTPAIRVAGAPADGLVIGVVAATGGNGKTTVTLTTFGAAGTRVAEQTQTIEVSILGGVAFATTDSTDIDLVGPPTTMTVDTDASDSAIGALATGTVVAVCTTDGGFACLQGTVIPFGVTGAGLVASSGLAGAGGVLTMTVVPEDQNVNIIAVVFFDFPTGLTEIGRHEISVGEPISGGFNPAIAAQGQTFTVYGGGSVAQLIADLQAANATSATATLGDGSTVTVIVTTLTFVNADFTAAFSGFVPDGTILAVRSVN